ncbi:MAG TPA: hypothetical protein DEQ38_11715 [Elusimicrobia bacterium]|nr:hypothetical protein [Elusimicrobiota bacterium]
MNTTKLTVSIFTALLFVSAARASDIRVIAPYAGIITNEYASSEYQLDMKDTGSMRGLFAQWVAPDNFQVNAFYYYSPDVNYCRVSGLHLNADWYPLRTAHGKYALGAGLETLTVDLAAVGKISGVDSLLMDNNILFHYLRAGRYFYMKGGAFDFSLMPYAGYAFEKVTGDLVLDLPGPFPPVIRTDIGSRDEYPMGGLNAKAVFRHFLEVQAKWMGRFTGKGTLNEYSGLVNLYFNKHWGVSYRYKYMEYGTSSNMYHLAGLIYSF